MDDWLSPAIAKTMTAKIPSVNRNPPIPKTAVINVMSNKAAKPISNLINQAIPQPPFPPA